MDHIFVVRVQDWLGHYISFSHHKSKQKAEEAVKTANEKYATTSAYVDEVRLEE